MSTSAGALRGHLFHICRDQKVGDDRVDYLDLLLDIWVGEDGEVLVMDREELVQCRSQGLVSEEDMAGIDREESRILSDWGAMVRRIDQLRAERGDPSGGPG